MMIWRLALHERLPDGIGQVRELCFRDVIDGCIMLDAIDLLAPDPTDTVRGTDG